MPYLGRPVTNAGQFEIIDDISSGFDGSEKSFTLQVGGTDIQPDVANVTITLGGVYQVPSSAYSITGSAINFSEAPESNTTFHGVLAGQSQFIESDFITNTMIKSTAAISGSKIDTDFSAQSFQLTNVTASGAVSASGTITANQYGGNVSGSSTSTGSFGKVEVGSGKITTAGNMVLDADGAQIRLQDGGTEFGRISRVSSDLVIKSISNNNDILFKGVDGSSTITALQLDMSEAGNAIFNNDVTIAGTLTAQEFHTEFTSASIVFTSGSTKFGDTLDDIHEMTGSLRISGSSVGIGTTTMDAHVNINSGTGNAGLHVESTDSSANISLADNTGSAALINIGGRLVFETGGTASTAASGGTESMTISGSLGGSGLVGIGTNSPDSELHVVAAGSPSIRVTDTTNTVTGKFQTDNSVGKIGTHTNHSFELFTNNTTALTINNSQNAELNGDLLIEDNSDTPLTFKKTSNGEMFIRFLDQDSTLKGALIYRTDSNFFSLRTDGTTALSIDSGQNASFASAVTSSLLLVEGVSNYTGIEVKGSGASRPQVKFTNVNQGTLGQIYGTEGNDLSIVAADDIILDATGEHIYLDDGGTNIGNIDMGSQNLTLRSSQQDKDIIFRGQDGASEIAALTLDMSEAGKATFNAGVVLDSSSDTLSRYDEGEATIYIYTSNGTKDNAAWTNRSGYTKMSYVRVGDMVTCQGKFELQGQNNASTDSAHYVIFELPFTVYNGTDKAGECAGTIAVNRYAHGLTQANMNGWYMLAVEDSTVAYIVSPSLQSGTEQYLTGASDGNWEGQFSITYRTQ